MPQHSAHTTAPIGLTLVIAGLAMTGLAGCSDPFRTLSTDYDRRATPERLRQISSLPLTPRPPVEADDGVTIENAGDLLKTRFDEMDHLELSLEQVRAWTLENNLDLQVALVAPTIAAEAVAEEEGRFNAVFGVNARLVETDEAVVLATQSAQASTQIFTPSITVPLRTGGSASVSTPIVRQDVNNPFSLLNPAYSADLEFRLSQPVLRGAGRRATLYSLRVADYNRQISEAQTKLEVIRQLAAADRAYWRLFSARQALLVRYQQYELAIDQLGRARRLLDAGQGARIEVTRAESGVAERIEAIVVAQNEVLLRQRDLKRLINVPGLDIDNNTHLVTMTDPDETPYDLNPSELADWGVRQRMEMLELELRLAIDAATVELDRNDALPLVTLDYVYRFNGLGDQLGRAINIASENDFEDWEIGVRAEIPLGNEQRLAQLRQSVLQRVQRLATRDARRLAIRQEVLDAADQLKTDLERIRAAEQAVILNTRTLEAEQNQFRAGRTTSNEVLDADTRLAEAKLARINAAVDYQIAQIDLAFATGTLLGAAKVEWAPAPTAPIKGIVLPKEQPYPPAEPISAPDAAPGETADAPTDESRTSTRTSGTLPDDLPQK